MSILTGKKIIILGDRDGISATTIEECVRNEPSAEVIYAATEFFAGHMDLDNQKRIRMLTEKHGFEKVLLLIGTGEKDSTRLAAQTVTSGDPSGKGALAGIALKLPFIHVLETPFKEAVSPALWKEHLEIFETALDYETFEQEIKTVRG